jgi:replicative DNA helicase
MQAFKNLDDEIMLRASRQADRDRGHLTAVPNDDLVQLGEAIDPWEHDERRYKLGIENIDFSMHPRRAADFLVVGALPGGGKTSILEQSSVTNARDGHKVLVVSLEMTISDLENKIIGREMGCDVHAFERHRKDKSEKYNKALSALNALPLKYYRPAEGKGVTVEKIFAIAERWEADMIAVDYAAMLEDWEPGNKARAILNFCAAKTKETGIYMLMLAQLKTEAMLRKNFRPTLADFEDSRAFSKAPTGVVLIHRPFNGDPKRDTVAEFIVAKNRRLAPSFRGHVHWHGPTTSFFAMTQEEESKAPCCWKPKPQKKREPDRASGLTKKQEDDLLNELDNDGFFTQKG